MIDELSSIPYGIKFTLSQLKFFEENSINKNAFVRSLVNDSDQYNKWRREKDER